MQGSCGRGVLSISQDCFYKDLTPDQMASISTYNFDHPAAFDFAEILSKLKQLRAGAHFISSTAFHLSQHPVSVVYARNGCSFPGTPGCIFSQIRCFALMVAVILAVSVPLNFAGLLQGPRWTFPRMTL